jgi:hypothetical protein
MRFKIVLGFLELGGQRHGIIMPTSPRAIYVQKSAKGPNIFGGSVHVQAGISFCRIVYGKKRHTPY